VRDESASPATAFNTPVTAETSLLLKYAEVKAPPPAA